MIKYSNLSRCIHNTSASLNPFHGPFNSISEGVLECIESGLRNKEGKISAFEGTVMTVKNPNTNKITMYVRNTSISEDDVLGWEEVGKDLASYITFQPNMGYDILTVVNPDDPEHPVEYELYKKDTYTTTYGEITIKKFSYPAIALNGGSVYPTIEFSQPYHEEHSRLDDVDGFVPTSDANVTYEVRYTSNANSANANQTVTSTNGIVTRSGANSISGQRCKIADVTVNIESHGKTASAEYAVYQVVVSNKTYTIVSSSLSYPTLSNAGTETITPTVNVVTKETIEYTEGVATTSSNQTHTTFRSIAFAAGAGSTASGDTVASKLSASTGTISGVGLGTYRRYTENDSVKTTLATITANISVYDSRDVSKKILTANPTFVLKQDTRAPQITNYNYKTVVTGYTYNGDIEGDGGSVAVKSVTYKIQHLGVREDGSTEASYSDVEGKTNLTLNTVDNNRVVSYAISGTAAAGTSIDNNTGTITKTTVGSVSATTNVGTFVVTISTKIVDEVNGATKNVLAGTRTAVVTQKIRQVYVYYGTSYDLLSQGAPVDRTNSSKVTSDEYTFTKMFNSDTDYVLWIAVPDGYTPLIVDPTAGNITVDFESSAVTTTGYKIYQFEYPSVLSSYSLTITLSKD